MTSGQLMWGPDGRHWHFDSGSLALDFGYTGDYGYGRPEWERLHVPADLDGWLASRFGPVDRPSGPAEFREALALREAIVTLAHAAADEHPLDSSRIDLVNRAAALTPVRPHLDGGTHPLPQPRASAMLSTIAGDAIDMLQAGGHRVRRCAASDCALIFCDHSRPNARRWCSMARCGNRAKVRAHRASEER